jgi:hypothetical protein
MAYPKNDLEKRRANGTAIISKSKAGFGMVHGVSSAEDASTSSIGESLVSECRSLG